MKRLKNFVSTMLVLPALAWAQTECPFIRPPGLTPDQVNSVVATMVANALKRHPQSLGVSKTIKRLDDTDSAIMNYAFVVVSISEALGFDAGRSFFDAAKAKGASQPFDSLSVSEIQEISRAAYAKGKDGPPPPASADAEYLVHRLRVRAPQPTAGWLLVRCGGDDVTFQRSMPAQSATSTASVRVASMPPFKDSQTFVAAAKVLLAQAVPAGYQIKSSEVSLVEGTTMPCADASVQSESSSLSVALQARFCYASKGAAFDYATLFAHASNQSVKPPSEEALLFVRAASPK
jgi:hypothetical protein